MAKTSMTESERVQAWRDANPEKRREMDRATYAKNPEPTRLRQRRYEGTVKGIRRRLRRTHKRRDAHGTGTTH